MDKLLERHKLPKPTQEELGNLNSIILIEESELKTFSQRKFLFAFLGMQPRVLHTLGNCCTAELHPQIPQQRKFWGPDFNGEFYQTFREKKEY